jgi:hypothetical protein
MAEEQQYIDLLKQQVWEKSIGTKEIVEEKNYFEQIAEDVFETTHERIHWHTVRNLYEGRHNPSTATLNILATYLLGSRDQPRTFQHFIEHYRRKKIPPPQKRWYAMGGILLVVGLLAVYTQSLKHSTQAFSQKLTHSNLEVLENQGWFLFPDSIDRDLWVQDTTPGFLTLKTYLGDSWLENIDYEPKIINILARKLRCGDCCTIEVVLAGFNPYQRYQMAGFYLFEEKEPWPSLRYCLDYAVSSNNVGSVLRLEKYWNERVILLTDGRFLGQKIVVTPIVDGKPDPPIDSLVLKLRIEGNQYSFYKQVNDQYEEAPVLTKHLPLKTPRYIGLYAAQGRPEIPSPIYPVADTIYAHFQEIRIKPCDD